MKKTLIALLLVGSSSGLLAQNTQTPTNNSNTNTPTTNTNPTTNSSNTDVNTSPTTPGSTNANTTTPSTNVNPSTVNPSTSNPNSSTNTDVNTNPTMNANMNTNTNSNSMNNAGASNNMNSSSSVSAGNYNAYGTLATDVPTTVRYSFQKEHPDVTGAQWYQTPTGQLKVMYKDANNQDMDAYYYGTSAQSYMISLPLRQSLTSDDVVAKAKTMFGLAVYDINRVKAANMEDVYHVRLLDNGQVKSVWISEQGTEVAATDVFRSTVVAESDVINEVNTAPASDANSSNSNNNNSNSSNSSTSPAMNNTPATNNTTGEAKKNSNNSSSTENTTTVPAETNEVK